MYFQIENTPEYIRRARRSQPVKQQAPKEEIPRLVIAPFSRPPQVVFEDVLIGTSCERELEVFNPTKQVQQITLGKELPPGLVIHLPGKWLTLEPETCYCLVMAWTPMQPMALRETIRFTNDSRGRYDVIIVLKSAMTVKGKAQPKTFKISPGKINKKKTGKRSPVAIYKKKAEAIYNTTEIKKTYNVVQTSVTKHQIFKSSNKENVMINDHSMDYRQAGCPFGSPSSMDFTFDTAEVFSNYNRDTTDALQQTYDNSYQSTANKLEVPKNVLKPSNPQNFDNTATDMFDNLTFTPLKSVPAKRDKLDKGPQIILSVNSGSDFDDSLDMKYKENATHSIVCITSSQQTHTQNNKWMAGDHPRPLEYAETPTVSNKKIPNTSSPKEYLQNSPNFSINTDFSRISDLSFLPQRFSTEKKTLPTRVNDTHNILDDANAKPSSDTFTKESPIPSLENDINQYMMDMRPPHYAQPKMCRQSLFREYQQAMERNYLKVHNYESDVWQNELHIDTRSPPRSITPPLQSIPEESAQTFSDTQVLDRTNKHTGTFTMNQTFDKPERQSISHSTRESWSKKAVRAESELWKVPISLPRKSIKGKTVRKDNSISGRNATFECNETQNISLNHISNVYSQSLTVDPFLSSTYFYDEQAVDKFEKEFKRWLNCILTPPADLDSNVEMKIDVGKAWIENRNKEIPAAPTKEQVCSRYHNNHRLDSLRRTARALLMSPEIAQVFLKLNAQIEKKLIVIRNDRNPHLDVGLQKAIMELLLSYNPLWLRIGLEAIYGLVIPLKSNSDIEGLTTFIIQRMFKNPHLKNKHSKSNAPNMLLPAYMEAIKKFTLKKFFMLVFFLDQAKQRKIISHDPCLFCRNAVCKESREIVIRFTREVIAGIGDITKHLRPLGYVVSHKQSYLDEYKYAVHNIAVDIRDGVRITKVMEIILMKNGLMNQLRTPAISRLQKIHNVQVALNALKEANFTIVGDINANDIADGHREKTLSLLWQLIHVFRAPLFETAANVIQTWWRKKYEVIVAKRIEEEKIRQKRVNAASVIQCWWRRIQYNRLVEWKMQQITTSTIVIQKFCRMWLAKSRFRKVKKSVTKIEEWYRSVKLMRQAKETLQTLRKEREDFRHRSAIKIQTYVRRWLCIRQYDITVRKIVLLQSIVRCIIVRKWYVNLKKAVILVQQKYRGKLLMREEMRRLSEQRQSAIRIQSYYRMRMQKRMFDDLKKAVKIIKDRYIALIKMREEKLKYETMKRSAVLIQALCRGRKARLDFINQKNSIVKLQRRVRANRAMKQERAKFLETKKAAMIIQTRIRAYLEMKKDMQNYKNIRHAAVTLQKHFRSYLLTKSQRNDYIKLKNAALVFQKHYRNLLKMREERTKYVQLKIAAVCIQNRYRALMAMRTCRVEFHKTRNACITIQRKYRALVLMRESRSQYLRMKSSCTVIQNAYRAHSMGKQQRQDFLKTKKAAICIQQWFRRSTVRKQVMKKYQESKQACVTIQRIYRAYIVGNKQRREYLRIRTATVCIQKYYRQYVEMKMVRQQYVQLKTATVQIQKYYRAYVLAKTTRTEYLRIRTSTVKIQSFYRQCREAKTLRHNFCRLRKATIFIQRRFRELCLMRKQKTEYLRLKQATLMIQQRFKALLLMRQHRNSYQNILAATKAIQRRYRATIVMRQERSKYIKIVESCRTIQRAYRAVLLGRKERVRYLKMKQASTTIQRRYRAILAMRKEREAFSKLRKATITIQRQYRAQKLMLEQRTNYAKILEATRNIQMRFRAYIIGSKQRQEYLAKKKSATLIQKRFRMLKEYRRARIQYLQIKRTTIFIQRRFRANKVTQELHRNAAANKIQVWYRSIQMRKECRQQFITLKTSAIKIQSGFRMYVLRKRYSQIQQAALRIQRYYRSYRLAKREKLHYIQFRTAVIKLQAHVRCRLVRHRYLRLQAAVINIQRAYRLKVQKDLMKKRRETAAVCIQKNFKCYLAKSRYRHYRKSVICVQTIFRSKLVTRLVRCEYLQKRRWVIQLQAAIRGYLGRKDVQAKMERIQAAKEERRLNRAASKIQALFRGHHTRQLSQDRRVSVLRRRWQQGALRSTQQSLKERYDEAMQVLSSMYDIETVISAFRSLDLLTETFPMLYVDMAVTIVRHVYNYMSVTNRSISSVEMLKGAAAVLVNLARCPLTGPSVYARDRIAPVLKYMWRFSNSETQLFCFLCTYLWLFNKYDSVREDLKEYLHIPENHKMLVTIRGNVDRMRRMAGNSKSKFSTPQTHKFISHTANQSLRANMSMNMTVRDTLNCSVMPALEPDYGITRVDRPRYFEDPWKAIHCVFTTYKL